MSRGGVRRGFTLIELLIVIAIIGILAGVVLISIGGQTDSAKNAVKRTEARQLVSLAAFYASTNGGSYEGVCASNTFIKGDGYRIIDSITNNILSHNQRRISIYNVGGYMVNYNIPTDGIIFYAACVDASLNSVTKNGFAFYWIHSDNSTLGCVDSTGTVILGIPPSWIESVLMKYNRFPNGVTTVRLSATGNGNNTNVACK